MVSDAGLLGPDDWESGDLGSPDPDEFIEPQFPAYLGDRLFYRLIGAGLVAIVVIALLGLIGLAAYGKEIPEAIVAMGSAAIGALAGVLTVNRG